MSHPLIKELTMLRRMRLDVAWLQNLVDINDDHTLGSLKALLERLKKPDILEQVMSDGYQNSRLRFTRGD